MEIKEIDEEQRRKEWRARKQEELEEGRRQEWRAKKERELMEARQLAISIDAQGVGEAEQEIIDAAVVEESAEARLFAETRVLRDEEEKIRKREWRARKHEQVSRCSALSRLEGVRGDRRDGQARCCLTVQV